MNHNVGLQHPAVLVWTGAVAIPRQIDRYNYFGFTFEVTGAIAADAVFKFVYHDADEVDPCLPGPANDVNVVPLCQSPAFSNPDPEVAQITIPAGTPIGQLCVGTIPCRPGKFVSLAAVSGTTANVRAVMTLSGPQI